MTIRNVSNEILYIPQLPVSGYRKLEPGNTTTLSRLFPEDNEEVISLIHQGKLMIIADGDIEDYTFNVGEPELEIDQSEIEDSFTNIRLKG